MRPLLTPAVLALSAALVASCVALTAAPSTLAPQAPLPLKAHITTPATVPLLATGTPKWAQHANSGYLVDTPIPVVTLMPQHLSPTGPWLAFASDQGLWAADVGTGAISMIYPLTTKPYYPLSFSGSSSAALLAFAEPPPPTEQGSPDPTLAGAFVDLESDLLMVHLPDPALQVISPLFAPSQVAALATESPPLEGEYEGQLWYLAQQIRAAYGRPGSIAWSPDGTKLAFSAAIDGTSADLYLFDVATRRVSRLSTGPTQAASPVWSPDGRFILHKAVLRFNIGSPGTDRVSGLWSAAVDGSSLILLSAGDSEPDAWLSDTALLVHRWVPECGSFDLRIIDVATARSTAIWQGSFEAVAADPASGTILLGNPYESTDMCPSDAPTGLFILTPGAGSPRRIAGFEFSKRLLDPFPSITWSEPFGLFTATDAKGKLHYSTSGQLVTQPARLSMLSDYLMQPSGYCNRIWTPDVSVLAFSDDSTVYLARAPLFEPEILSEGHTGLCATDLQFVFN